MEKVVISNEDIQHLHNTVTRILELIKKSQGNSEVNNQIQTYEQIKELISVDTLKTMQLLGFNYKAAIGEPLTLMLRNFILAKVANPDELSLFQKVVTPEMVEILKNETADNNFRQLVRIVKKDRRSRILKLKENPISVDFYKNGSKFVKE